MDRKDEFWELKNELDHTPVELEYTAAKAITRAKKSKRRSLLFKAPLVSFCSVIVTFVVLVNLFPAVALAMSNTLGIKDLLRAVAVNPSLKRAVEHDYYQEIGDSQTQEDVTVTIDYMILDAGNISFFFHIDAPVDAGTYHCEFLDANGKQLEAGFSFDTGYKTGKLEDIEMQFPIGCTALPDELTFKITVNKDETYQKTGTAVQSSSDSPYISDYVEPEQTGVNYVFSFKLHPDKQFSSTVDTVPINQWVEIKGQRIHLDNLYIYPSVVRLSLFCDDNNSSVIEALDVCLDDDKGNKFNGWGSLFISEEPDKQKSQQLTFESCYFSHSKHLKLYINSISMIEKKQLFGKIDYANKMIENMPESISIETMDVKDDTLYLALEENSHNTKSHCSILELTYYDINDNVYPFNGCSMSTSGDDKPNIHYYKIKNFKDNYYKIKWSYRVDQKLDKAVVIDLK